MIEAVQNIFNIPDLRKRILFMLGLLAVYRVGAYIPTPGIDAEALRNLFSAAEGTLFGFLDLFSGGNFRRLTIFALGIMPYITASIILQLLTVVWPYLEKLSKEGELGRRKITTYTRYLTVVLSAVQSAGIADALQRQGNVVVNPGVGFILMTMLTLTTGTAFIMWLGEQITERGIGNGMSLIIFAGIVVGLPRAINDIYQKVNTGDWSVLTLLIVVAMMVVVVAFIVLVERGQRRIPVQYAKRVVGRRVLGGQSTHLPLRVNTGGVIPVIFASSILTFPQTFGLVAQNNSYLRAITDALRWGEPLYNLLYVVGIIFFCYFYTSIIFNPNEVADNMRKYGGFIPGIRPGKRTAEYVNSILTRITLVGALYLALIAIIPEFLYTGFHVQNIPFVGPRMDAVLPQWFTQGLRVNFYFGGTSLLIVVGVAMDTIQMVESQLIMRHYDGFLKKGRVRGRRG
ncbi:MAG: preprotein translocase subunit SecY [Acidobacteria bacterium 13_1_20CM_2_57_8]|nr:MAG: preprotein translocase subunit SecY [Acidobacteria bacterium 13_1_20CM_2_57_8]